MTGAIIPNPSVSIRIVIRMNQIAWRLRPLLSGEASANRLFVVLIQARRR